MQETLDQRLQNHLYSQFVLSASELRRETPGDIHRNGDTLNMETALLCQHFAELAQSGGAHAALSEARKFESMHKGKSVKSLNRSEIMIRDVAGEVVAFLKDQKSIRP